MLILILDSISPVYVCDLLNLMFMIDDFKWWQNWKVLTSFETHTNWNLHLDTLKTTCVGLDFETHDMGLAGQDELLV